MGVVAVGGVLCIVFPPAGVGVLVGVGLGSGIGIVTGTFNPGLVAINGVVGGLTGGVGNSAKSSCYPD